MKSIAVTYPDFRSLPKGIKRMLVNSESLFFDEAVKAPAESGLQGRKAFGGRRFAGQNLSWRN